MNTITTTISTDATTVYYPAGTPGLVLGVGTPVFSTYTVPYGLGYTPPLVGLDSLYSDVRSFHVAFNHPAPNVPTEQPLARANTRGEWIVSEVEELKDARTLVDQADAYIDIIYFAVGGLVELGIKPQPLWNIVQRANMAKLWQDGKPRFDETGKVKKPVGWQKPEPQLAAEVERQLSSSVQAISS